MIRTALCIILLFILVAGWAHLPYVYAATAAGIEKDNVAAEKQDEEGYKRFEESRKLFYDKMAKRTKEWRDLLDNTFFTLQSYAKKAIRAKDLRSEREFITVLSDYNSVLGDLGLMQVILDLGKFVEDKDFMMYFERMESGYERLKDSFSFKNEVFLDRIAKLKNQDALRFEKKLLKHYKDYFEYDLRLDNAQGIEEALKQEDLSSSGKR